MSATAAENTGFVEVPLVQALEEKCKAAGKPAPGIQLYDNNANCIQAILSGRADTYVNDVNTVDGAVKAVFAGVVWLMPSRMAAVTSFRLA